MDRTDIRLRMAVLNVEFWIVVGSVVAIVVMLLGWPQ